MNSSDEKSNNTSTAVNHILKLPCDRTYRLSTTRLRASFVARSTGLAVVLVPAACSGAPLQNQKYCSTTSYFHHNCAQKIGINQNNESKKNNLNRNLWIVWFTPSPILCLMTYRHLGPEWRQLQQSRDPVDLWYHRHEIPSDPTHHRHCPECWLHHQSYLLHQIFHAQLKKKRQSTRHITHAIRMTTTMKFWLQHKITLTLYERVGCENRMTASRVSYADHFKGGLCSHEWQKWNVQPKIYAQYNSSILTRSHEKTITATDLTSDRRFHIAGSLFRGISSPLSPLSRWGLDPIELVSRV